MAKAELINQATGAINRKVKAAMGGGAIGGGVAAAMLEGAMTDWFLLLSTQSEWLAFLAKPIVIDAIPALSVAVASGAGALVAGYFFKERGTEK